MDPVEATAFALTIAMVICNARRIHWGWPLAIASSAMYTVVFYRTKLYGEAGLQILFILLAFWGWWKWFWYVPCTSPAQNVLKSSWNKWEGRLNMLFQWIFSWGLLWCMTWASLVWVLKHHTDSQSVLLDGFTTSGSVVATLLLARMRLSNWIVWLLVNGVSVWLFASKGLWLTTALYALLAVMSGVGWWMWLRPTPATSATASPKQLPSIAQLNAQHG